MVIAKQYRTDRMERCDWLLRELCERSADDQLNDLHIGYRDGKHFDSTTDTELFYMQRKPEPEEDDVYEERQNSGIEAEDIAAIRREWDEGSDVEDEAAPRVTNTPLPVTNPNEITPTQAGKQFDWSSLEKRGHAHNLVGCPPEEISSGEDLSLDTTSTSRPIRNLIDYYSSDNTEYSSWSSDEDL